MRLLSIVSVLLLLSSCATNIWAYSVPAAEERFELKPVLVTDKSFSRSVRTPFQYSFVADEFDFLSEYPSKCSVGINLGKQYDYRDSIRFSASTEMEVRMRLHHDRVLVDRNCDGNLDKDDIPWVKHEDTFSLSYVVGAKKTSYPVVLFRETHIPHPLDG